MRPLNSGKRARIAKILLRTALPAVVAGGICFAYVVEAQPGPPPAGMPAGGPPGGMPAGGPPPGGAPVPTPASKDPAAAVAGTYKIDLEHQSIVARILHSGRSFSTMRFGAKEGTLQWDPANPGAIKLDVTVDADPHYDPIVYHFMPEDMLKVKQFPVARFVSTTVRKTGATTADVEGQLTLMGVTKPAVIHAQFIGASKAMTGEPALGFTGDMTVTWSDFAGVGGMNFGEVKLVLDAEFLKQ